MDNETYNLIKEQLQILPPKLKTLAVKQIWVDQIDNIAKKYNLNDEQTKNLEQETFFILLGMTPFSAYRTNLVNESNVSYDQALKIAYDANQQIFESVMDDLKTFESEIFSSDSENIENNELSNANGNWDENQSATTPDRMLPDHETLEKTEGVHLHNQTVMPAGDRSKQFDSAPKKQTKFSSIIDQKLGGMFRQGQSQTPSNLPTGNGSQKPTSNFGQKNNYAGKDPYREPIDQKQDQRIEEKKD